MSTPATSVELRESRILPDLINTPEATIDRVSIERGPERLVFERRGRWPLADG